MNPKVSAHTSKGVSTKQRIIRAARQSLIKSGYDAFVMRELAQDLDIKLGNLQYYFKTKELLVLEVLTLEAAEEIELIETQDPRHRLVAIVGELVSRWRGESGTLFSMLSALALHNKSFRELYRSNYKQFYLALEEPIKEINPGLDDEALALKVRLVTALIDGSPMQVQVGKLQDYLAAVKAEAERIALS